MKHFLISLAFPCALFAWTICLDPGHGGTDPGAIGTYYTEKQANLDVANWAKFYMDKVGGITWTSMTRYSDMDVSLEDRVNYANTNDFDRFISIHQNAYNGSVQGTETYCYTYGSAQSFALRDSTHPELVRAYLYNDRGAQTAGYYVLRYTSMPAILGEGSFIDYNGDYNESWRYAYNWYAHSSRQGHAYTKGLCKHLGLLYPSFVLFTDYPDSVYSNSNFTVRDSFYVAGFQANADLIFEVKSKTSGNVLYTERTANISPGYWIRTFGINPTISLPDSGYDYYVYFISYIVPEGGNWNNRYSHVSTSLLPTKVKTNPTPDTSCIVYKSYPEIIYADSSIFVQESLYIAPSQAPADLIFEIKHRESGNILYHERIESLSCGHWIKTFGLDPQITLADSFGEYEVYFLSILTPPGGGWSNRYTYKSTYTTPTTVLSNSPSYILYKSFPDTVTALEPSVVIESLYVAPSQRPADLIFEIKNRTTGDIIDFERVEGLTSEYYNFDFSFTPQDSLMVYSVYFLSILTPPGGNWSTRYRYASTYNTPTIVLPNPTTIDEFAESKNEIIHHFSPSGESILFLYNVDKSYDNLEIKIYDVTGRIVDRISAIDNTNKLEYSGNLKNGVYYYLLTSNELILARNKLAIVR
ncbi:MAG TPA: N-acetylmuramoyl-L-alanine amidase [Candidatus Hydrothermia bacterium]|nr:N-acetylmuramoyl-L-alanine amidase [Candidatus Hydrothermae bacterium]HRD23470.1 N-acetylmuramoyl-L-alanine amidase [Candidatus Hydrothermia bacterium]